MLNEAKEARRRGVLFQLLQSPLSVLCRCVSHIRCASSRQRQTEDERHPLKGWDLQKRGTIYHHGVEILWSAAVFWNLNESMQAGDRQRRSDIDRKDETDRGEQSIAVICKAHIRIRQKHWWGSFLRSSAMISTEHTCMGQKRWWLHNPHINCHHVHSRYFPHSWSNLFFMDISIHGQNTIITSISIHGQNVMITNTFIHCQE